MEGKTILLFDVDKTLSPARQSIQPDMLEILATLHAKGIHLGIVSGSDFSKVKEQVTQGVIDKCEYTFAENGLYAMRKGEMFAC